MLQTNLFSYHSSAGAIFLCSLPFQWGKNMAGATAVIPNVKLLPKVAEWIHVTVDEIN